jgi:hypothetical protein
MQHLDEPKMVFVVARGADATEMVDNETAIVNFMMTQHPGNVFLCRGSFLLIELRCPRPIEQWSEFYINLLDRCDALYCVEGYRTHPLADWALENNMPILDDYMDLELFLSGLSVQNPE